MSVGSAAYCSSCGAARPPGAQFCPSCGRAYDGAGTPAAAESSTARQTAMFGGIAWLGSAAMIAYLGLLQLGYVGSVIDAGDLQATAIWNLVTAALTLFFAARLLTSPTRGILGTSAAWAALTAIWGAFQIANGVTHWAYIGATVAALAAGILSLVARSSMPAPPPATWTPTPAAGPLPPAAAQDPTVVAAPVALPPAIVAPVAAPPAIVAPVSEPPTSSSRSRRPLVIGGLLIAGLGLAAGAFVLLWAPHQKAPGVANVPTPSASRVATLPPTIQPPPPEPVAVAIGEASRMRGGNNQPLGDVTVIDAKSAKTVAGDKPGAGKRYVVARVSYDAKPLTAPLLWLYSKADWRLEDDAGHLFRPLSHAPEPTLTEGALHPGDVVAAWLAFEVPKTASGLTLQLMTTDGDPLIEVPVP